MAQYSSAWITGASSGIGAEFARVLAGRGTRRLVLVARDAGRLRALADTLSAEGAECVVLRADLTQPGELQSAAERLAEDAPELLINNAGCGTYGEFAVQPVAPLLASIDLNVRALVALSHAYVGTARARDRGALLLVASTAGFLPVPYEAVYAASKSFVIQFGEALAEELRATGVVVRTLCPGFTSSEFAARAALPAAVHMGRPATAEAVARAGLAALDGSRVTVAHGVAMQVAGAAAAIAPRALVRRMAGWWMRRGLRAPD